MKNECKKCGKCCKGSGGVILFPKDLSIMAKHLSIEKKNFVESYCEKYFIETKYGILELYLIKRIQEHCIFLNKNLCSIYNIRPFQCRYAPHYFLKDYPLWNHIHCLTQSEITFKKYQILEDINIKDLINGYFY